MSESGDDGAGSREVAYRLFAAEYEDADRSYSESDEERAPNYVVTPTGARVNRLFVVGVLTEVEEVSEDVLRARVVDPTGAFVLYAGQYQPDEQAMLERTEPPTFVAVTGKARTFQPEDSDRVFTSVRPESISEVDADTRDRWTVQAAEQTLDRVAAMATAFAADVDGPGLRQALVEQGIEDGFANGIEVALDHYGTTPTYLAAVRAMALDAARLVTGDIDEVDPVSISPDATGDERAGALTGPYDPRAVAEAAAAVEDAAATASEATAETEPDEPTETPEESATAAPSATTGGSAAGAATADQSEADPEPAAEEDVQADATAGQEPVEQTADTGAVEATDSGAASESATAAEESDTGVEPDEGDVTAPSEAAAPTGEAPTEPADGEPTQPTDEAPTEPADGAPTEPTDEAPTEPTADEPTETAESADSGPGDFDPGEFDLDDEERAEIEDEYGTDFQSGTEVEEPGTADIDTAAAAPEAESAAAETGAELAESTDTGTAGEADETQTEPDESADTDTETGEAAGDVDLEDVAVETMSDLDDGEGAERQAVREAVVEETGADPEAVDDAIRDALMDGRCYEPAEDQLKPI